MAYFPTASAFKGFAEGLNIGKAVVDFGVSPNFRPDFFRSSSHIAQGQASRKNGKE
jgi:hypothetical protein